MAIALGPYEMRVQVAFDAGPFNASPTWTEVTDDVMASEGVSFSRGARSVGGKPGPGLLDLRMRNWAEGSKVAGRWTPGVAASPWHPLKLKRRISLQARYNGGSWVGLWGGHITDYVPKWVGDAKPVCDLSASDLLTALSLLKSFPSAVLAEQLYDSPIGCWPLDEAAGSTSAGDRSAGRVTPLTPVQLGSGGAYDFGAGSFGPEASTGLALTRSSGSVGYYLAGGTEPRSSTHGHTTVEAVVLPSSAASMTALRVSGSGGNVLQIGTDSAGKPVATLIWSNGETAVVGSAALSLTEPTHLAATVTVGATVELFVDGVSAGTTSAAVDPPGLGDVFVGYGWSGLWDGQVANVAVYDTVLSPSRIADRHLAMTGWAGELTGSRFQRLARLAGLPSGLISVASSAGGSTMGAQPVGGKTLTTALSEVAVTEQGKVVTDLDGLLRFAGRDVRIDPPQVVVLDARTDILNDFDGLPVNDEGLLNDVTVTRVNGATQRAVNQASVDEYGAISDSIEAYLEDDEQARSLAEWLANKDAEPQLRAPVVKVSMGNLASKSPGKVAAVMALEIGQRITLSYLPDGLPGTTLSVFVEGISDEWGKNDWVRTITTSSLLRNGAVWVLGDPIFGVLGSTTILGY
jgi:hypothetical protein